MIKDKNTKVKVPENQFLVLPGPDKSSWGMINTSQVMDIVFETHIVDGERVYEVRIKYVGADKDTEYYTSKTAFYHFRKIFINRWGK